MNFETSICPGRGAGTRRRWASVRKAALTLGLGIGLVLGATAGHAADTCFQDDGGEILVFKRFKMPRPNDCQPLTGHVHGKSLTLTGTACGSSSAGTVNFNFHWMLTSTAFGTYRFDVDRDPSSTIGNGNACDANVGNGGWGCSLFKVRKVDCPRPPVVP
jgi:hypothetical protein